MNIESVKTVSTKLAGHLPVEFERAHRDIPAKKSFETMDVPPSTERILYNQLESANADTPVLAQKIRSIDTCPGENYCGPGYHRPEKACFRGG
jgi:hypothetical protein